MEKPRDDNPGGNGSEENRNAPPLAEGAEGGTGEGEAADAPAEQTAWPSYTEVLESSLLEMERRIADSGSAFDRKEEELRELREAAAKVKEEQRARTRRLERDFQVRLERAVGEAIEGLLEVVDNLDLAVDAGEKASEVDSLLEGVRMVRESFLQTLARQGLDRLSTIGAPFDPEEAEAVSIQEVEDPAEDGVVVEEIRAGYRFKGHVLRPATVVVGRHPDAAPAESETPAEETGMAPAPLVDTGGHSAPDSGGAPDHHGPAVSPAEMEFDLPEDEGQEPEPSPPEEPAPAAEPEEEAREEDDEEEDAGGASLRDPSAALGPSVSPADIDFDEDSDSPEDPDAIDWEK